MRWLTVERDQCRMGMGVGLEMECKERKGCCRPLLHWGGWKRMMSICRTLMHTRMLKVLVSGMGGMEVPLEVVLMRIGIGEDERLGRGRRRGRVIGGLRMKGMGMRIDL